MSEPIHNHRLLLRATLEFTTPFLVGAGREGDIADAIFVSDANGLPAIPGSSLTGVLRSAFLARHGKASTDALFGFQDGREGKGSRLAVSWACIHDAQNRPVEGIVESTRLNDEVLKTALVPTIRDHVKINHKGASDADARDKFDEQAVCAGHRFTFEMELAGKAEEQAQWERLLAVLRSPELRLGGKTRRGFGAFKLVSLLARHFDLGAKADFDDYRRHPVSLAETNQALKAIPLAGEAGPSGGAQTIRLRLRPTGYWMFGGGVDRRGIDQGDADMAPVRDSRIVWTDAGRGSVSKDLLIIPATGIKGALAHRVAFHYNALKGVFADKQTDLKAAGGENNEAVKQLFGYCKDTGEDGQRGRVIMNDLYLAAQPSQQLVHHVGIDRFTGGARDSVLFCERPIWQGDELVMDLFLVDADAMGGDVRQALRAAIKDLAEGRLQVGAGSGRGMGYLKGTVDWPEALSTEGGDHA